MIDAHQHFWQLERNDYGWLTSELTPLYRDFIPKDLKPSLARNGIEGTILVQAAPTLAETEFLLKLADETPFVLGVVGWVDFEAATAPDDIARLAAHPKLVGLRPMIQDIADDDWMLGPNLTPAFEAMVQHGLTFDALVLPRHLLQLGQLLERHPELRTVIDHSAKPEIAADQFDTWAKDMSKIAKISGANCKFSGLLTEAGDDWSRPLLVPYINHLIEEFGTHKLIWGSDWPVLKLASDYDTWLNLALSFLPDVSDQKAVFGENAAEFYRLRM